MELKVACVQYRSSTNPQDNMARAYHLAKHISHEAPDIIVLPEHTFFLGKLSDFRGFARRFPKKTETRPHEWLQTLQSWSQEFKVVLVAGSVPELDKDERVFQTAVIFFPDARSPLTFRKRMLFRGQARHRELDEACEISRGEREYLSFEFKGWNIGLTLCAELRYSHIFQAMRAQANCDVALIPASFYHSTGKDHFLPLLIARAIEFQMYVISANQCGSSEEKFPAFVGQSCIIDPWGKPLSLASMSGEALCFQELSRERLQEVRGLIHMFSDSSAPQN